MEQGEVALRVFQELLWFWDCPELHGFEESKALLMQKFSQLKYTA